MSENTKIIGAAIFLLFPVLLVIMHWAIFLIWVKRKIRGEDEKVASGLPGVPLLFALAAFVAVPGTTFRNNVAIAVMLIDPMNWLLSYAISRWIITGKFYGHKAV